MINFLCFTCYRLKFHVINSDIKDMTERFVSLGDCFYSNYTANIHDNKIFAQLSVYILFLRNFLDSFTNGAGSPFTKK